MKKIGFTMAESPVAIAVIAISDEEETIRIRCDFPMTVYYKKQKLDCCKGENIFAVA